VRHNRYRLFYPDSFADEHKLIRSQLLLTLMLAVALHKKVSQKADKETLRADTGMRPLSTKEKSVSLRKPFHLSMETLSNRMTYYE
jgi:hypothetical protein